MRELFFEWKKMIQAGKGLILVGVLLMLNLLYIVMCIYTINIGDKYLPGQYTKAVNEVNAEDLDTSFEKLDKKVEELKITGYGYSTYQALADVCDEIEGVQNYPVLLQQLKNVSVKHTLSSLSENGYDEKNKIKISQQYKKLNAEGVTFIGGRGLMLFMQTDFSDVFLLIIVVLLGLSLLTTEYEGKMLPLLTSSGLGRRKIAASKGVVGIFMTIAIVLFLFIAKLLLYTQAYNFSDWQGRIQSVYGYANSTFSGNILEFICMFIISKTVGYVLLFGIFYLLASLCQKSWKFLFWSGIFLAVSSACVWWIDENSWLLLLKRFSPLICVQTDYLFSCYRNINLFGQPVSYLYLWCFIGMILFIFCFLGGFLCFGKQRMAVRAKMKTITIADIAFTISDKLKSHSFFCWEWRKSWLGERGSVIFLLGCCLIIFLYTPIEECLETQDEVYYKAYVTQILGPYTVEKKQELDSEKKRLAVLEEQVLKNNGNYTQQALKLFETELEKKNALDMVIEYADYLEKVPGGQFVYERGYELLFGQELSGSYLKICNFFAVFFIVILSIPVWGIEEWTGMHQICTATPYGMRRLWRTKKRVVLLYGILVCALAYIPWIYNVVTAYRLDIWDASIQSLRIFSDSHLKMPISICISVYYFLHMVYIIFIGLAMRYLQRILHGYALTGIVGVFLFILPFLVIR